jgi:cob(I)alamin adenosyltransferase
MRRIYSGSGDDGYTGLLGEGRIPKCHPQLEAIGSTDEASAILGLARSMTSSDQIASMLRNIQRDLSLLMAEIAATLEESARFQSVDQERIKWLEAQIDEWSRSTELPKEFVLSGDSKGGAIFDLARTVVRRAERAVAGLHLESGTSYEYPLMYLNRLSSLCFILAIWENQRAGGNEPALAKVDQE